MKRKNRSVSEARASAMKANLGALAGMQSLMMGSQMYDASITTRGHQISQM